MLRGAVTVGLPPGQAMALPQQGVAANARLDMLDVDAWDALLDQHQEGPGAPGRRWPRPRGTCPTGWRCAWVRLPCRGAACTMWVAGVSRAAGADWRANVSARELDGYVEYRPRRSRRGPAGGAVTRACARLALPQLDEPQVDALLDARAARPGCRRWTSWCRTSSCAAGAWAAWR